MKNTFRQTMYSHGLSEKMYNTKTIQKNGDI